MNSRVFFSGSARKHWSVWVLHKELKPTKKSHNIEISCQFSWKLSVVTTSCGFHNVSVFSHCYYEILHELYLLLKKVCLHQIRLATATSPVQCFQFTAITLMLFCEIEIMVGRQVSTVADNLYIMLRLHKRLASNKLQFNFNKICQNEESN